MSANELPVSDLDPDQLDVTLLAHETAMQLGEDSVSSQLVADVLGRPAGVKRVMVIQVDHDIPMGVEGRMGQLL